MVAAGNANRTSARYPTIDVLRGLALISMISAHMDDFKVTSFVGRVLHSGRWVDGAFFFVALSGLVTGLVHRRVVQRAGFHASATKLVRRAGFLYLVHIALVLTILTSHSAEPDRTMVATPTWAQAGGLGHALERLLVLRLEPNYNTILPIYVALLLWAVVAVFLLRSGRTWAVVGISVAVYLFGQTVHGLVFTGEAFDVTGWQLLFTGGLIVGWRWEHERRMMPRYWRTVLVCGSGVVAGALYCSARLVPAQMGATFGAGLGKTNGGWLAFVFAGAVLVVGYAVIDRVRQTPRVSGLLRPVEILGTKGLPGYVAMVLAILVLDLVPWLPRNDLMLLVIVVVCGAAEYWAVQYADHRPGDVSRQRGHVTSVGGTSFGTP